MERISARIRMVLAMALGVPLVVAGTAGAGRAGRPGRHHPGAGR